MVITEVRIKLVEENNERLLAFCSVTFDNSFVIRDLKIIEGTRGCFVAMPSRKLTDRCGQCGCKNHLRSRFCNNCGHRTDENRAARDPEGRTRLHADIAHPINSSCREGLQQAIIRTYHDEKERSRMPGYICTYDDYDGGEFDGEMPASAMPRMDAPVRGARTHTGHPVPRPTHMNAPASEPQQPAVRRTEGGAFGSGIM